MRDHLRKSFGLRVPKYFFFFSSFHPLSYHNYRQLILDYYKATDPAAVQAQRAGRIRRRVFYAAGVNHIWAFDQHDKWMRFGLRLHMGVEPFTGVILWLIVWWSNSNPKLVAHQYIKTARRVGGREKKSLFQVISYLILWCRLANDNTK
jgi:hypothetical protein